MGFSPTIGKNDVDLEVVVKQVAAVVDVIFTPHRNLEISLVYRNVTRSINEENVCDTELLLNYTKEASIRSRQR